MGSQSWKAPWGSASTLAFSSSNAIPTIQTGIDNHKSTKTRFAKHDPHQCHRSRSKLPSAQEVAVTFTVDRSRAPAGLCLEQHDEEKQ